MIYQRELSTKYTADICVIGGGPSGIAAAVAASRQGADVFLIEAQGYFGGSATSAMVPTFVSFTDGVNFLGGGIGREVFDRCFAENPHGWYPPSLGYQIEGLKRQYDEMITAAGVRFLFFTQMIDAICDNGTVTSIIVAAKSGIYAIEAKAFVDCTGDADLCAKAGAPFAEGNDKGEVMGASLCSMWVNVDWEAGHCRQDAYLDAAFQDGVFTVEDRHLPGIFPTGLHTGGGNIGHTYGVRGTREEELTQGMITGRKQLPEFVRYYQDYVGGAFKNAYPVATGNTLGIRESRRIVGDYVLTAADYYARAVFVDEIGRYAYGLDLHEANASKEAYDQFCSHFYRQEYQPGDNYGIPYRCLTPKTLDNVLVAGRSISTSREMLASIRVMPCCFITGQAAGVAAAMCAEKKCTTREVDVKLLQERLLAMGAYLPNCQ